MGALSKVGCASRHDAVESHRRSKDVLAAAATDVESQEDLELRGSSAWSLDGLRLALLKRCLPAGSERERTEVGQGSDALASHECLSRTTLRPQCPAPSSWDAAAI